MITLRPQQIRAFEAAELELLERRVLEDLRRFWTEQVSALGEDETRQWIRSGFERARSYGIYTRQGLYRFVNLMFFLGGDFDGDLPWARRILEEPGFSGREKLERLVAAALEQPRQDGEP